jgi:tape measure domain-containing protein
MQFDNKEFERNVQTSLSTMEKLKQSLKFTGATKGLEDVDNASKKVNMLQLGSAVEQIGVKFNAMQVMAVTALTNITNSAVNSAKRLVSAFTIDPIKTGLQEYETQINAVQTILANTESKGTTLEDVNGALDELNTYADKTIYNFTEMTRNIGTFTAAGVDLDTSVNAIQGIANLAAVSGSTSQQASTAMYQLSQALSSGTVKLMDWNSVVNAGMGGQVFQDALKETARVHGINIDAMIEKEGSFRETLSSGWLSADILTETLSHFTMAAEEGTEQWNEYKKSLMDTGYTEEQALAILKLSNTATNAATKVKTFTQLMDTLKESAQSGWTQTWEILIGDFEEAKSLWTSVSDTIGGMITASAEARNEMLQGWKDMGGRQMVIDSISNAFTGLMNILKPIGQAFREVFPAITSQQLLDATKRIKELTEKFREFTENSKNIEKIKSAFKGLFSIISIVVSVVKEVAAGLITLASNIGGLIKSILNISGSFGDWISNMRETIDESGVFKTVIGGTVDVLQKVIDKLKVVFGYLKEKFVAPGFDALYTILKGIWKLVSLVGTKVFEVAKSLGGALAEAFGGGQIDNMIDIFSSGVLAAILLNLKSFISNFTKSIKEGGGFLESITDILDSVKDALGSFQDSLKAKTLMEIAKAIALLAASLLVLSLINPERMTSALMGMTFLFAELMGAMAVFTKIGSGTKGIMKTASVMVIMSTSVLILAGALAMVSTVDTAAMINGVLGIAALMAITVAAAKAMSGDDSGKITKGVGSLILFAAAIKILASAVQDMSSMSLGEMIKGLAGVGVLMTGVSLFLSNTKISGKAVSTGVGIVLLAASMKIFASAIQDFSDMSWEELGRGLVGLAGALLAVTLAVNFMPKNMLGVGVGLLAISAAMLIMANALTQMGNMSWEQMGIGLITLGGSLGLLALGLHAMNGTAAGSAALIIASTAVLMLASSITKMGGMSWEQMGIGLLTLGGSLAILAAGLYAMSGTIAGSAALLVAALAISILAPAMILLGSMSWQEMGVGLLTLAGALTIMGLAGVLLGPLAPVLVAISGAMLLLGVGVLSLGVGLTLAATGLTALAAAFGASGPIIVAGITATMQGIIGLIPALIVAIGQGIIGVCNVLAASAGSICSALATIIVAVVDMLVEVTPTIVNGVFVILQAILDKLVEFTPKIIEAAVNLIVALLDGLAEGLPKIVESAVTLIENFLLAIGENLPRIVDAGFKMIISFIDGLTKAITNNTPVLVEKMRGLMKALISAAVLVLTGGIVDLNASGGKIIDTGLIKGIRDKFSNVKKAMSDLMADAKDKITEKIKDFKSAGKDVISGFIKGIREKISAVGNAASEIGKKALGSIKSFLGIESPSKEFTEVGRYSAEGMVVGLKTYAGKVAAAAGNVGSYALEAMRKSISGIGTLMGSDLDGQPTIRPVLDLSAVTAGANSINRMFDMSPSVGVMSTIGAISSSMNGRQNGVNNDVVAAIKDLGSKLGRASGDTYQVNGVTYDDGSNIVNAIEAIVREARIERRV